MLTSGSGHKRPSLQLSPRKREWSTTTASGEALVGVPSDGAAGSNFESLTKLSCMIDPNAIRQKDRSGADCTLQPGN